MSYVRTVADAWPDGAISNPEHAMHIGNPAPAALSVSLVSLSVCTGTGYMCVYVYDILVVDIMDIMDSFALCYGMINGMFNKRRTVLYHRLGFIVQ